MRADDGRLSVYVELGHAPSSACDRCNCDIRVAPDRIDGVVVVMNGSELLLRLCPACSATVSTALSLAVDLARQRLTDRLDQSVRTAIDALGYLTGSVVEIPTRQRTVEPDGTVTWKPVRGGDVTVLRPRKDGA